MNKRTFAIPIIGAAGLTLATACGSDPVAGAWELTGLTDGDVVRELPRFTESGNNTYEEFGSIVFGDDLRGALTLITYVQGYYGSSEEFRAAIFEGVETAKRMYSLDTRGDFQASLQCEVGEDSDGDDELTCSGQQENLQSITLAASRFAEEE